MLNSLKGVQIFLHQVEQEVKQADGTIGLSHGHPAMVDELDLQSPEFECIKTQSGISRTITDMGIIK